MYSMYVNVLLFTGICTSINKANSVVEKEHANKRTLLPGKNEVRVILDNT